MSLGLLVIVLVLASASPASAHASLVETDPGTGAIVDAAPTEVSLRFNESVAPAMRRFTVLAPNGGSVDVDKPQRRDGGKTYAQRLKPDLARGTYVVTYRVVSADGHPVSGSFTFSVKEPSAPAAAPSAAGGADVDSLVLALVRVGRYAGYAGASLVAGALVMFLGLWPRRLSPRGLGVLAVAGWGLLIAGSTLSLVAQVPYEYGGTFADVDTGSTGEVLTGSVGTSYLVRLGLSLLAAPLLWLLPRYPETKWLRRVAVGIAVAAAFTWPYAGHPAANPAWLLAVAADAAHVAAMAAWLGGLVVLLTCLLTRANRGELAAILPVWSRWATFAVVTIVVTGVVQVLLVMEHPSDLYDTWYGQLVLIKSAGFAVVLAGARWSRRYARRWKGDDRMVPSTASESPVAGLRRAMGVEVVVAAVVLAAAVVLTATPPPSSRPTAGVEQRLPYTATATSGTTRVQIDVDPAQLGTNSVHLTAFTLAGEPASVKEWRATAALPGAGIEPLTISLLTISPSHAVGEVLLPKPGKWEFRFLVRTSDVDQITVDRKIRIRE